VFLTCREEFVRRPKNTAREQQIGKLVLNAGDARGFVYCAVKFGT